MDNLADWDDDLDDLLTESLEDPVFKAAYEDAQFRVDLMNRLTRIRKAQNLKQRDVAKRMETTQSAISELESGEIDPHFSTLQRYARAVAAVLRVDIDLPAESPWATSTPSNYVEAVVQPVKHNSPNRDRGTRKRAALSTWKSAGKDLFEVSSKVTSKAV